MYDKLPPLVEKWGVPVVSALLIFFALRLFKHFASQALARREKSFDASSLNAEWLRTVRELLRGASNSLFLALSLWAVSGTIEETPKVNLWLGRLFVLLISLQAFRWAGTLIDFGIRTYTRSRLDEEGENQTTFRLLGFLLRIVCYSLIVLLALSNFGVNVTALVTGLGVGGIAVALAVQNILGDLFASMTIAFDKPFVVGEFIATADLNGTVERVGLKTTRIRSLSGELLVVPNSYLLSSQIRNFKHMRERRVVFSFGIVYELSPDVVARVSSMVKDIIGAESRARFERAHFKSFGSSSLDFEVVYWVTDPDYLTYMDIQERVNLALMRRFALEGIAFAYPTQTVYQHHLETPTSELRV
jgi:small-conductance mechanosensitive channel